MWPLLLFVAAWCGGTAVQAQSTSLDVKIQLQACIVASATIEADTIGVTEAHLFNELFKGLWASSQHTITAPGDDLLDLTIDDYHGKCNVIFVGIVPSDVQKAQLTAYSQRFQVRIVYFDGAETANDVDVQTRLGIGQWYGLPLYDPGSSDATYGSLLIETIQLTDAATPRVVNSDLQTNPLESDIYTRPVRQVADAVNGTTAIVANYADADGTPYVVTESSVDYPTAAVVTYAGDSGEEEMHVFFALAWWDLDSWAWGHYIAEWGTKGIFAGERRFWLGAMVDDLFLGTNVFEYDGDSNEGTEYRMSGSDLETSLAGEASLNSEFNAEIVTEYPFNANGILEQVDSAYVLSFDDADAALLTKGDAPTDNGDGTYGIDPIHATTWWAQATIDGMTAEFNAGSWDTDDLLAKSIELKDSFFWQSHTMSHLARDDLGESDCDTEDGGNARIAVIVGLFDATTYDWRSMTTPGITGLFNVNCLSSATANLITCAPGDNTYDGVQTDVSLVSTENQFHSIYTTEATNGFAGFQIAPRFATNVYYNCVDTDCLILENLYTRRTVCGCTSVDPGTIDDLNTDTSDCTMTACSDGLEALLTVDNIFETEAKTTARWIMTGRRDKYMFHQANSIPTTVPSGTMSLLEYWYESVLTEMATYLNLQGTDPFSLRSVKFDDLCTNFQHHEELDDADALVTVTKTSTGSISGMELSATNSAGVIPVTVPSTMVTSDEVSTTGLPTGQPYLTEEYGSDTTFYVATSEEDEPEAVLQPTEADLAAIPGSTPAPVTAATPAPITAPTPAPLTPVTPAPISPTPGPITPSPVTAPTPAPLTPATPAPITPTPGPITPSTPAPVTTPTPAPLTPATTSPITPTPGPNTPSTPAPVTAPTPAPLTPVTTSPITPTPGPNTPSTPAPVTAPTPAPLTPSTTSPTTPTPGPNTPSTPAPVTAPTPAPITPSTTSPITDPTSAPIAAPTPDIVFPLTTSPVTPTPGPVTPSTAAPVSRRDRKKRRRRSRKYGKETLDLGNDPPC